VWGGPSFVSTMQLVQTLGILITNLIISYAAGCACKREQFQVALKKPWAVFLCISIQYGLRPFSAFCVIKTLGVPANAAIGLMLCCFAPGGNGSNMLEIIFGGDVELGIVCTITSTLGAVAFIPMNYFIYVKKLDEQGGHDKEFVMPWGEIAMSVACIVVGATCGAYTRHRNDALGKKLEHRVSAVGIMFLLATVAVATATNLHYLKEITWNSWLTGIIIGPITIAAGYLPSRMLLRLNARSARTVTIEVAECNIGLAFAMMLLIWPFSENDKAAEEKQAQIFQGIAAYTAFNEVYIWGLTFIWYLEKRTKRIERKASEQHDAFVLTAHAHAQATWKSDSVEDPAQGGGDRTEERGILIDEIVSQALDNAVSKTRENRVSYKRKNTTDSTTDTIHEDDKTPITSPGAKMVFTEGGGLGSPNTSQMTNSESTDRSGKAEGGVGLT